MHVSPKLRGAALIAALAATAAAVRWADTLPDLQEASAGAVVGPTARSTRAAPVAQDGVTQTSADQTRTRVEAPTTTEVPGALDLRKLQRPRSAPPAGDLFGPRDFRPAPPPAKHPIAQPLAVAAPAPPPPPPSAPPLPFTYIGKLAADGETTVFLASGDRNLVVKTGDVIDNTYRLDQVSDTAVVLTHLPTSMQQTLAIGAQQ